MHGLIAVFGRAARDLTRETLVASLDGLAADQVHLLAGDDAMRVAVLAPPIPGGAPAVLWGPGGTRGLAVGGYLLLDDRAPAADHPERLLHLIAQQGLDAALNAVIAGSFNLAVLDVARGELVVANDRLGSIPLYYLPEPDGGVVTTIPGLLGLGRISAPAPDWTACAEILYTGYTVGDRYVVAGARRLRGASVLRWDARAGRLETRVTRLDPTVITPAPGPADLDDLGDRLEAACRRLARVGGRTAHFLSGGMDSRLILAAWPGDAPLHCYSYGPERFPDVVVARAIATARGATFTHVPLSGDAVAESVEDAARWGGVPVFPNRYLAARRVSEDGFDAVLDGCLGDAYLGGSYYKFQAMFSRRARYAEKLDLFVDHSVARVGLDALVEAMWTEVFDPAADEWAMRHLAPWVAARLAAAKDDIRQDVWSEIRRLAPWHESVSVLLREFRVANRNWNYIAQQAVACRRFLRVDLPLIADWPLLEALYRLRPAETAFRKLQIRLLRRRYPEFAALPYAASLLPLKRPALLHHWAPRLRKRGLSLPFMTPVIAGPTAEFDEWGEWLRGSAALRARAVELLCALGFAEREPLQSRMDDVAQGHARGVGELVHLAGLAPLLETRTMRMAARS
ncbi:MAG TPA: asparagine synthase-related protein [Pseudomonadales bacterium]|nr:asparagine synthase-related protein [Pseudomonadales bacterium]